MIKRYWFFVSITSFYSDFVLGSTETLGSLCTLEFKEQRNDPYLTSTTKNMRPSVFNNRNSEVFVYFTTVGKVKIKMYFDIPT